MKKINLLVLFLVSFFVGILSFSALTDCVDATPEEFIRDYYHTNPAQYGLTWVVTTKSFKDFGERDVDIEIYDQPKTDDGVSNKDTIFIYKKVTTSNEWTLLACTTLTHSNSYWDKDLDEQGEQFDAHAPIFRNSCDYSGAYTGGVSEASNPLAEIYNNIRLYIDSDTPDLEGIWGIGKNDSGVEGLAYGVTRDNFTKCEDKLRLVGVAKTNPDYHLTPRIENFTVKSTYTVKLRELLNDDITGVRTKTSYEKNPCEMQGVLKVFRIARRIIEILKIIIPIGLIIMGGIDFYKVVSSPNDNELSKSIKTLTVRIVISIIIFFIPTLVNVLVNALPSKDKSDFYNCKVCFFGDEKNSSKVCDTAIETKAMVNDDKNKFYANFRSVEKSCAQSSGYEKYVNDYCAHLSDQTARDNCNSNGQLLGKYTLNCVCKDDSVNGYNEKEVLESCAKQFKPSVDWISDEMKAKFEEQYNKCVADGKAKRDSYYIKTCVDDYTSYYNSSSAIERLTSIRNGGK